MITYRPALISKTFHGRDLFAPALAKYLNKDTSSLREIDKSSLQGINCASDIDEIIYFDGFGNAVSGRRGETIAPTKSLIINEIEVKPAQTFSAVARKEPFWYTNSMGLIEIAINQGNAKEQMGLNIGLPMTVGI